MRIIVHAVFPHEPFSRYVRDGSIGAKMNRILGEQKPEAAYFTEFDGRRSALLVVNLNDSSQIPSIAEPWFLTFNADCHFHPAMAAEDLAKSDLASIGSKWK
jgi:hypothetical protein